MMELRYGLCMYTCMHVVYTRESVENVLLNVKLK